MTNFTKMAISAALAVVTSLSSVAQERADLLWVAGDGMASGWNLDKATCLVADTDNGNIYSATLYLNAGQGFKFLTKFDFGNPEYRPAVDGAAPDANGEVQLSLDNEDNKIVVSESANYLITFNSDNGVATILKSSYQDTPAHCGALFMVGGATPNGWSIDDALVMRQNSDNPMQFSAQNASLSEGTFKIFTSMKGARSFSSEYFYFRDADNEGKMIPNSSSDDQWAIPEADSYDITANLLDNTISIKKHEAASISGISVETDAPVEYYNLQGIKISAPEKGQILIKAQGNLRTKIIF